MAYKPSKRDLEYTAWIDAITEARCWCLKSGDFDGFVFLGLWARSVKL